MTEEKKRREEYVLPDGRRTTSRRTGARLIPPLQVAELAWAATTRIHAKFFVATAERESGFATNEVDTEPNGFVSEGLYQLSAEEADDIGMHDADLLDPVISTRVFARLQERRLSAIIRAAIGPPILREPDVWAYLGLAHNQGLSAALKTIKTYGLNWDAYKERNPTSRICRYGDAMIDGGTRWPEVELAMQGKPPPDDAA